LIGIYFGIFYLFKLKIMGLIDAITNPFVSKSALKAQENVDKLFNVNPKSKVLGSFQALTKKTAWDVAFVISPLATLFVNSTPIIGLVLEDSLLLKPIKNTNKNFEYLRIFWTEAEKYHLKITTRGLLVKMYEIEWELDGNKYSLSGIEASTKEQWDKLNLPSLELLKSMCDSS